MYSRKTHLILWMVPMKAKNKNIVNKKRLFNESHKCTTQFNSMRKRRKSGKKEEYRIRIQIIVQWTQQYYTLNAQINSTFFTDTIINANSVFIYWISHHWFLICIITVPNVFFFSFGRNSLYITSHFTAFCVEVNQRNEQNNKRAKKTILTRRRHIITMKR